MDDDEIASKLCKKLFGLKKGIKKIQFNQSSLTGLLLCATDMAREDERKKTEDELGVVTGKDAERFMRNMQRNEKSEKKKTEAKKVLKSIKEVMEVFFPDHLKNYPINRNISEEENKMIDELRGVTKWKGTAPEGKKK